MTASPPIASPDIPRPPARSRGSPHRTHAENWPRAPWVWRHPILPPHKAQRSRDSARTIHCYLLARSISNSMRASLPARTALSDKRYETQLFERRRSLSYLIIPHRRSWTAGLDQRTQRAYRKRPLQGKSAVGVSGSPDGVKTGDPVDSHPLPFPQESPCSATRTGRNRLRSSPTLEPLGPPAIPEPRPARPRPSPTPSRAPCALPVVGWPAHRPIAGRWDRCRAWCPNAYHQHGPNRTYALVQGRSRPWPWFECGLPVLPSHQGGVASRRFASCRGRRAGVVRAPAAGTPPRVPEPGRPSSAGPPAPRG